MMMTIFDDMLCWYFLQLLLQMDSVTQSRQTRAFREHEYYWDETQFGTKEQDFSLGSLEQATWKWLSLAR
jgi:hypothetical protein